MYKKFKNHKISYYSNCDNLNKFNLLNLHDNFHISKVTINYFLSTSKNLPIKEYYTLYNFFYRLPFVKIVDSKKDVIHFTLTFQNKVEILSFLKILFIENQLELSLDKSLNVQNLFFDVSFLSFSDVKYIHNNFDGEVYLPGSIRINIALNNKSVNFKNLNIFKNLPLFWISG